MIQERLFGTGVALVTPFLSNGEVDFKALNQVTEHIIANGVDYLVVMGTTAESATLSKQEKEDVLRAIIQINHGRIPIVYGIGGNYTELVVQTIKSQDFSGIDAVLTVTPYYNKPNQSGLYRHFETVAQASPVPIILYNVPGRTGVNLQADTALRLAYEIPNIVATKEASGNLDQIMTILRDKPDSFMVISGDDALTFPMIALGASGVISVVANAVPDKMATMVRLALQGNYDVSRKIHFDLLELVSMIFREGSPAGVKAALGHLGLCDSHVRLPLTPVSRSLQNQIATMVDRLA